MKNIVSNYPKAERRSHQGPSHILIPNQRLQLVAIVFLSRPNCQPLRGKIAYRSIEFAKNQLDLRRTRMRVDKILDCDCVALAQSGYGPGSVAAYNATPTLNVEQLRSIRNTNINRAMILSCARAH